MPAKREQALRVDLLDSDLERDGFVLFLALGDFGIDRGAHDFSSHLGAGTEGLVEPDAKPLFEFGGIGEGAPDTLDGRTQQNFFLDPVAGHYATSWLHSMPARRKRQPESCGSCTGISVR